MKMHFLTIAAVSQGFSKLRQQADGRWQLQGSSKAEEQLNAWLRQS